MRGKLLPTDQMTDSENTCSICMEGFTAENPRTELECGHGFHARCVIDWFRSSSQSNTCPLCRADPSTVLTYPDAMTRCTMLRRKARAADAPPALKRAVEKIQRAEKTCVQLKEECKRFKTEEIRKLLKDYRELHRKKWAAHRAVSKAKRELGLRDFPGVNIAPMIRTAYRRLHPRYRLHF